MTVRFSSRDRDRANMANAENVLPVVRAGQGCQDPSPTKTRYGCRNFPLCRGLFLVGAAQGGLPLRRGIRRALERQITGQRTNSKGVAGLGPAHGLQGQIIDRPHPSQHRRPC